MALVASSSIDGVSITVERLLASLERRGIEVFARVDHAAGAHAAGLELADEVLVVFGDPRVGTLLMQSDPSVGYELPLRMLVWTERGQTRIGYRPARELEQDYELAGATDAIARIDGLLEQLAAEAAGRG